MVGRRIALIVDEDSASIGEHVTAVARSLVEQGDRVTIAGPRNATGLRDTGARFFAVDAPAQIRIVGQARAAWKLRTVLRGPAGGAPDVMHAFGSRAGLAVVLSGVKPVPLVVTWWKTVDDSVPGGRGCVVRQADRVAARSATVSLCAGSDLVTNVLRLGAMDARRIEPVVPETVGGKISGAGGRDVDDVGEASGGDVGGHLDALYRELTGR